MLNTPWNYLWQQWLEETFPGSKRPSSGRSDSSSTTTADVKDEKGKEKEKSSDEEKVPKQEKPVLDVKNTAKKFLMDQTFGATANTVAFIAGMGALKGRNGPEIVKALRQV